MSEACERCGLEAGEGFLSPRRCAYETCPSRNVPVHPGRLFPTPPRLVVTYGRAHNGRKRHIFDWTCTRVMCETESKVHAHVETQDEAGVGRDLCSNCYEIACGVARGYAQSTVRYYGGRAAVARFLGPERGTPDACAWAEAILEYPEPIPEFELSSWPGWADCDGG